MAIEQSDPWAMTPDQRAYYLAQFFRLQPDPSGRLSGQAAKSFFELSKLPVNVLSQIWELSDVDTDGQLNLSEFSVAMHLVVLHRNGVMLPTQLPESLLLVATSSTLSAPPPPPPPPPLPLQPSPPTSNASVPDTILTITTVTNTTAATIERRLRLCEHHSFDSTLSGPVHATTAPSSTLHRRWSASSPTDNVSLAEGMTSFDGRLVPNAQVRHPIAIRANPLQVQGATLARGARAPTPPPRARAKTMPLDTIVCPPLLRPPLPLAPQQATSAAAVATSSAASEQHLEHLRVQQLTEALVPLQKECERIVQENNVLTMELIALQKRRIALEILLERLTPL
ncbi:ralbp1 associated eps domain containing protein [Echinococcus multilocularis]|uniref:Ralbp1 associated eps domain containing protein n=1 Tax=Echinococcus multilocularis TaxID=6211 RepID=A0A068YF90_ECHMU|nr:ralbp1 associated eps domain containing protein [Echinococcus multilocularis]